MNILLISSVGAMAIALLYGIFIIIKLIRKKNEKVVIKEIKVEVPEKVDLYPPVESFTPVIKTPDQKLYEAFITEYDDGSLKFNDVPYRPGAAMTCGFGISEGYKYFVKNTNRLWDTSQPVSKREMRWG